MALRIVVELLTCIAFERWFWLPGSGGTGEPELMQVWILCLIDIFYDILARQLPILSEFFCSPIIDDFADWQFKKYICKQVPLIMNYPSGFMGDEPEIH